MDNNMKNVMWLCQKCLKKVMETGEYSFIDDYVDGNVCELCGKHSRHLSEVANDEGIKAGEEEALR